MTNDELQTVRMNACLDPAVTVEEDDVKNAIDKAIDTAFTQQVCELFKVFCISKITDSPVEAATRFSRGLNIAMAARKDARSLLSP